MKSTSRFAYAALALAGYADLWLAGFSGGGLIALLRWRLCGDRAQWLLGLLMLFLQARLLI
jgi:hypothetical protein